MIGCVNWTSYRWGAVGKTATSRLVFPGVLRLIAHILPREFPFQSGWKMSSFHLNQTPGGNSGESRLAVQYRRTSFGPAPRRVGTPHVGLLLAQHTLHARVRHRRSDRRRNRGFLSRPRDGRCGVLPEEIRSSARLIGGILGLVVAVVLLRYYVEWILRGRYGDLRLAVVRKGTLRGNVLEESAAGSPVTFTSAGN